MGELEKKGKLQEMVRGAWGNAKEKNRKAEEELRKMEERHGRKKEWHWRKTE